MQGKTKLTKDKPEGQNKYYFETVFDGLVGGFGVSYLNANQNTTNIYNQDSYLMSGYGDLYYNGASKKIAPNVSRKTTKLACLLDMDKGQLHFWHDDEDLGVAAEHVEGVLFPTSSI